LIKNILYDLNIAQYTVQRFTPTIKFKRIVKGRIESVKKPTDKFELLGRAAMVPGMQYMISLMQDEVARIRALVAVDHAEQEAEETEKKPTKAQIAAAKREAKNAKERERRAVKSSSTKVIGAQGKPIPKNWAGWSKFKTAAARSAEAKRRQAVREARQAKQAAAKKSISIAATTAEDGTVRKLHPRDAAHPKHAEWKKKMSAANRRRWASLTEEQRRQQTRAATEANVKRRASA
jgi:hypothetical protein